jgi:hypothetical protein
MSKKIDFVIPEKILNDLYEMSGGAGKFKGVLMIYNDPNGDPRVWIKGDGASTESGLIRHMQMWIEESNQPAFCESLDDQE